MKKILLPLVVVLVAFLFFAWWQNSWRGQLPRQAAAAAARGEIAFWVLSSPDGARWAPDVQGIPAWYVKTTGTVIVPTTKAAQSDLPQRLKTYNDALLRELKAQGKFHILEEDIARVGTNLHSSGITTKK